MPLKPATIKRTPTTGSQAYRRDETAAHWIGEFKDDPWLDPEEPALVPWLPDVDWGPVPPGAA